MNRSPSDAFEEAGQDGGCSGALKRQQGAIGERLDARARAETITKMTEVGFFACGVHDEEERVREPRRHQIVEDAAGLVQEQRVAHPHRRERREIARHEPL